MITHHELLIGMALLSCMSAVLLVLNLIAWRQNRAILGRLMAQEAAAPVTSYQAHQFTDVPTSLLVATLSRLERRIMQLEESIKGTPRANSIPAATLAPATTDSDTRYERAQQLLQESNSAEQVAKGSGLTLYEAELLLRIHRGP